MVVRSGCHVRIPQQQRKQQWLTSSSLVSLSTKRCLTNNTQITKTTSLTYGRVSPIGWALLPYVVYFWMR